MLRCQQLPTGANRLPCNPIVSRSTLPIRSVSSKRTTTCNPLSLKKSWISSRSPQIPKRSLSGVITFPPPKEPSTPRSNFGTVAPLFVEKNIDPNEKPNPPEVSMDTLLQSPGFRQFLGRTYAYTGLGLFGTLGVATFLAPIGMSMPLFVGGIVSSFASIFVLSWLKPEYKKNTEKGKEILYAEDSLTRRLSFVGLTGGMGVTMAPMMEMILAIDPMIVPVSLGLTASIFGGCWLFSKRCTDLSMMQWKIPVFISLGTLIGLQLFGLGSMWFFGPNAVSAIIHSVDLWGGIALFTGMTIYDMHKASKMYRKGKPDHLICAVNLYLDALNLVVRIMQIMAEAKKATD